MKQPTLKWPTEQMDEDTLGREEERKERGVEVRQEGQWVGGGSEEDNARYRAFLKYCEEMRTASKMRHEEDEERKRDAQRQERSWSLLRTSMEYLKEKEECWQQRKIREVDRIKEEEKRDRLAICKEKKKRYGIKTMNKEEKKRLKQRTEERIIISQAKANYWKK